MKRTHVDETGFDTASMLSALMSKLELHTSLYARYVHAHESIARSLHTIAHQKTKPFSMHFEADISANKPRKENDMDLQVSMLNDGTLHARLVVSDPQGLAIDTIAELPVGAAIDFEQQGPAELPIAMEADGLSFTIADPTEGDYVISAAASGFPGTQPEQATITLHVAADGSWSTHFEEVVPPAPASTFGRRSIGIPSIPKRAPAPARRAPARTVASAVKHQYPT